MTPCDKWKLVPTIIGIAVWVAITVFAYRQFDSANRGWSSLGISIGIGGMFAPWIIIFGRRIVDIVASILTKPNPRLAPVPTSYKPDASLQATFDELENVRLQTRSRFRARVVKATLIGALVGAVLFGVSWLFYSDEVVPERVAGTSIASAAVLSYFLFWTVISAAIGCAWGGLNFNGDSLYQKSRQRVLSKLAASFGLDWQPAQTAVLDDFSRYQLFSWTEVKSTDEICGTYRGLPLSIIDLNLIYNKQFQSINAGILEPRRKTMGSSVVFDGVVITLTLPRNLRGVTIVAPKTLGDSVNHLSDHLQPVHLEDPTFAKTFEVYASDQISSRALLTPAFMERFLALASNYGALRVVVENQKFIIALPTGGGSLFDLPTYRHIGGMHETLIQLHQSIATYLRVADAVIDLDQAAREQAAQQVL